MHESVLARAALPAPTTCLGRRLLPYSIGHELWLAREGNPVLRGMVSGLPAAVLICSRTWDQLRAMDSERWLSLDLALWHWRARRMDHARELARFIAYRADGLLEFPLSDVARRDRGQTPRLSGTPFILRLQQWLMLHLRLSESRAWDYPVGLAKMRWAAHWEQEGGLDVYSQHDAEFDEFVAEQEAIAAHTARSAALNPNTN
jgi:hypothetical protein